MWKSPGKPYMWGESPHECLDVGFPAGNGTSSPCGKKRRDLSTGFSTGETGLTSYLYLGRLSSDCPYLGVALLGYF